MAVICVLCVATSVLAATSSDDTDGPSDATSVGLERAVVHTDRVTHLISPYIYGANQEMAFDPGFTAKRLGGNRLTGYNWENNMSSAGSDWQHFNDGYLLTLFGGDLSARADEPGAVAEAFHETRFPGAYSLVTLQMAGYVSADGNRTVTPNQTAPSERWREVLFSGGSDGAPDTTDGVVYMDQFVRHLVASYGSSADAIRSNGLASASAPGVGMRTVYGAGDPGPIRGYSLDNEPGLWSETHPRIHPLRVTVAELLERSEALAAAVKATDPGAEVFGPALYGYNAFESLQNAPDWRYAQGRGGYDWFIDAYLDAMHEAEERRGVRLLDVLDVHWYPEARGTDRIVFSGAGATTSANVEARLLAPLSLWHPEYHENSWITNDYLRGPIELIPRLQASIDRYYSGTRLAFTEWAFGAEDHISGGIAVADVLGIFGRYDVYLATYWGGGPYAAGGYEIYRLPSNPEHTYGDRNLQVENPDPYTTSVYATLDDAGKLHLVLINKNADPYPLELAIEGRSAGVVVAAYLLDQNSSRVRAVTPASIVDMRRAGEAALVCELPVMSVVHLVVE
jgi:hypothetical protein